MQRLFLCSSTACIGTQEVKILEVASERSRWNSEAAQVKVSPSRRDGEDPVVGSWMREKVGSPALGVSANPGGKGIKEIGKPLSSSRPFRPSGPSRPFSSTRREETQLPLDFSSRLIYIFHAPFGSAPPTDMINRPASDVGTTRCFTFGSWNDLNWDPREQEMCDIMGCWDLCSNGEFRNLGVGEEESLRDWLWFVGSYYLRS